MPQIALAKGVDSVSVEEQSHALQDPVGDVLGSAKVCLKHEPHPHSVATVGGGVDGSSKCVLEREREGGREKERERERGREGEEEREREGERERKRGREREREGLSYCGTVLVAE